MQRQVNSSAIFSPQSWQNKLAAKLAKTLKSTNHCMTYRPAREQTSVADALCARFYAYVLSPLLAVAFESARFLGAAISGLFVGLNCAKRLARFLLHEIDDGMNA
jgi:hypothetical protein